MLNLAGAEGLEPSTVGFGGAEGLEPSTVGFGDRCSTIGTMLLQKVAKLYAEIR